MNERYIIRGKSIQLCDFVYGNYFYSEKENRHYIIGESSDYGWQKLEIDPTTVGQCIGLRDKNGVLIFEGDIISNGYFSNYLQEIITSNHLVKWGIDGCGIALPIIAKNNDIFEIIGNIHDNPEHLKEDGSV